jgi:hypothetical protein
MSKYAYRSLLCMLVFASNKTAKTERQFIFDERGDAKMLMHFIDAVWALPMAPACLLMLPAARSTPTVANRSMPDRHHLDANGFALRSLLVLPVTMAAMGFHVLQKMVAAMGGTDEVHERTRPSTVWTTSRASTCVGGVQGHHRGGHRGAARPRAWRSPCNWSGGLRPPLPQAKGSMWRRESERPLPTRRRWTRCSPSRCRSWRLGAPH